MIYVTGMLNKLKFSLRQTWSGLKGALTSGVITEMSTAQTCLRDLVTFKSNQKRLYTRGQQSDTWAYFQ